MQRFKQFLTEYGSQPFSAFLVARVSMPQINNVNDFTNFLDQLGVDVVSGLQSVSHLHPTQTDYDQEKVDRIVSHMHTDNDLTPIIISNDGFVADGHHRYYAAKQSELEINVLVVSLPINKLLKLMYDYTELRDG